MSSGSFYIYRGGEVAGPYGAADLLAMNLPPETQVCAAGTEEWTQLGSVPELLPPPGLVATPLAAPVAAPAAAGFSEKKKIFILHGRGNTMDDAFGRLLGLVRVKLRYYQGSYYVDAENSNFVRYLVYASHANPWTALFDRIIAGKLAICPFFPPPSEWTPDASWTKLSEFKVGDKMESYAVPSGVTGAGKRKWCDGFFQSIWADAGRMLDVPIPSQPALGEALAGLRARLRPPDGGLYLEFEYQDAIRGFFGDRADEANAFIAMLIEFQRLNDAGGDLDTIGSNALYGAWILQAWQAKHGSPPRYGRDYEFDFVNYHQSFLHLGRHANCDVYLPDFPMEAIPDLEEAARALITVGSFFVRIDDHHPMGPEKFELLKHLKQEGLIGDYVMSGGLKGGEEQPKDLRTCGADLVHRAMLAGTPFDNPGLEELRRLAHQQDLHFIEDPDDREHPDYLAIDLSKLIGSKYSRIDMVQRLMLVRSYAEMRGIMEASGWRAIVDQYEQALEESCPKLEQCMAMIEFMDPKDVEAKRGGGGLMATLGKLVKAITFGKIDLEISSIKGSDPRLVSRIFMTLAPFQSRQEHRINIASALNYTKRFYRYDYFFFAWGSSLLSTRRFNEEDQKLNLSTLASKVGGPGDGGHPSAATCKPGSNPAWPAERFSKLNKNNFHEYARYIAGRIEAGTGMKIVSVRLITTQDRDYK